MYVETLEAEMDKTIKDKPSQTAILQIFRLKAENPTKYREDIKVVDQGAALKTWELLKSLAQAEPKSLPLVGGKVGVDDVVVVEGDVKEIVGGDS